MFALRVPSYELNLFLGQLQRLCVCLCASELSCVCQTFFFFSMNYEEEICWSCKHLKGARVP